jgi:hypothetical protein
MPANPAHLQGLQEKLHHITDQIIQIFILLDNLLVINKILKNEKEQWNHVCAIACSANTCLMCSFLLKH